MDIKKLARIADDSVESKEIIKALTKLKELGYKVARVSNNLIISYGTIEMRLRLLTGDYTVKSRNGDLKGTLDVGGKSFAFNLMKILKRLIYDERVSDSIDTDLLLTIVEAQLKHYNLDVNYSARKIGNKVSVKNSSGVEQGSIWEDNDEIKTQFNASTDPQVKTALEEISQLGPNVVKDKDGKVKEAFKESYSKITGALKGIATSISKEVGKDIKENAVAIAGPIGVIANELYKVGKSGMKGKKSDSKVADSKIFDASVDVDNVVAEVMTKWINSGHTNDITTNSNYPFLKFNLPPHNGVVEVNFEDQTVNLSKDYKAEGDFGELYVIVKESVDDVLQIEPDYEPSIQMSDSDALDNQFVFDYLEKNWNGPKLKKEIENNILKVGFEKYEPFVFEYDVETNKVLELNKIKSVASSKLIELVNHAVKPITDDLGGIQDQAIYLIDWLKSIGELSMTFDMDYEDIFVNSSSKNYNAVLQRLEQLDLIYEILDDETIKITLPVFSTAEYEGVYDSDEKYSVKKVNNTKYEVLKDGEHTYDLEKKGSKWTCSCTGFKYRGKCFEGKTKVLTLDGWKDIKSLKKGDLVYAANGHVSVVNFNDKLFADDMLKVKISGKEIKCTSDHEFWVLRNNQIQYVEAKDLKRGDKCLFPKLVREEKEFLSRDEAFFVGLYAGDGHIDVRNYKTKSQRSDNRVEISDSLCLYDVEIALDGKYAEFYKERLGGSVRGGCGNGKVLTISDLALVELCYKYVGLTSSKYGRCKNISNEVLYWNKEAKRAFVGGLFVSDGTISSNGKGSGRITILNTSKSIIDTVYQILSEDYLTKYGMYSRDSYKEGGSKPLNMYYVSLSGKQAKDFIEKYVGDWVNVKGSNHYSFSNKEKSKIVIDGNEYFIQLVKSVEKSVPSEVYSIEVDRYHSYLVQDCSVNNCKHLNLLDEELPKRHPRKELDDLVPEIKEMFKDYPTWEIVGSYRRGKSDFKDIDILVETDSSEFKKIEDILQQDPEYKRTMAGPDIIRGTYHGYDFDVSRVEPGNWIPALLYRTGSKETNIKMRGRAKALGMRLNEKGLWKDGEKISNLNSEKDYFDALGMEYLEPEER